MSRINARIPAEQQRQIEEIRRATGASVSEIVRAAIERYHHEVVPPPRSARAALLLTGFIGCGADGDAAPDLSENYKEVLSAYLEDKHGDR